MCVFGRFLEICGFYTTGWDMEEIEEILEKFILLNIEALGILGIYSSLVHLFVSYFAVALY